MNAPTTHDIRGVLITVSNGKLLLPNASVAEVITYSDPEPVAGAPSWLLGWSQEIAALGAKVAVLKAIGQHAKMPYFAVLTQGFPRLVTIAESALVESSDINSDMPDGVYAEGIFNDDYVVVPDLPNVEAQIVDVLLRADATRADAASA
jgi:chemosensory pili system protein ChpC